VLGSELLARRAPGGSLVHEERSVGQGRVQFVRYLSVGVLSVVVDVSLLVVLHSVVHLALLIATVIAFWSALVVNYLLNHRWTFGVGGRLGSRVPRYAVLVGINFAITVAVVGGLTAAGLPYLLAKGIAVAVAGTVNFVGYRVWVFR
jgi:putative flippase GtrA